MLISSRTHRPEILPTAQGFDHYFGLPYSNDMARIKGWGNNTADLDKIWKLKKWDIYNNNLYGDAKRIEGPVNQVTLTDRCTEQALKFIETNKSKPFFLYMPHSMPHVPLFVSDARYNTDPKQAACVAAFFPWVRQASTGRSAAGPSVDR